MHGDIAASNDDQRDIILIRAQLKKQVVPPCQYEQLQALVYLGPSQFEAFTLYRQDRIRMHGAKSERSSTTSKHMYTGKLELHMHVWSLAREGINSF